MANEMDYEQLIGEWVTARCRKRAKGPPPREMPDYVKHWLETGGDSPVNADTAPTARVLGWLMKTIIDPIWDEPV